MPATSMEEISNNPVVLWMKERDAAILSKKYIGFNDSREIIRLNVKHKTLVKKLADLNDELESEISRIPKKEPEIPFEILEGKILSSIECCRAEEKVLLKEFKALKAKLQVDVSYERVVMLEAELKSKLERNKKMDKQMTRQERGLNRKDKKYYNAVQEIDNAKPNQIEEERLLRCINKEMGRQKQQEIEIKQNEDLLLAKLIKEEELEAKILQEEKKLDTLKIELQVGEEIKKWNNPDEFIDMTVDDLKELFNETKKEYKAEIKLIEIEKQSAEMNADNLRKKFKNISRARKINGHKLLELTRLIKLAKEKEIRDKKQENERASNLQARGRKTKSYQLLLKGQTPHKPIKSIQSSARNYQSIAPDFLRDHKVIIKLTIRNMVNH